MPIVVKIEGEERGKEGRTAPGATATAPKQPAGLAGDACSECGPQSSCKTTRCGCRWAGRNCVSCWCLVRCANVAPQTWQDKQQTTEGKPGDGEGQWRGKRRRGRLKGVVNKARAWETGRNAIAETKEQAPERRNAQTPPELQLTEETARGRGDAYAAGVPVKGEGASGDVPGYVSTPEDLRLREVYEDWVHGNPGTHIDGGVADNSAWQAWWRDLAVMSSRHYDAPSGKVSRRFVGMLGAEMQGVRDRRWTRSGSSSSRW